MWNILAVMCIDASRGGKFLTIRMFPLSSAIMRVKLEDCDTPTMLNRYSKNRYPKTIVRILRVIILTVSRNLPLTPPYEAGRMPGFSSTFGISLPCNLLLRYVQGGGESGGFAGSNGGEKLLVRRGL